MVVTPDLIPQNFNSFDKRISSAIVNPPGELATNEEPEDLGNVEPTDQT